MQRYYITLTPTPFSQSIVDIPVIGDFFNWITARPSAFTFNRPFDKKTVIVFYFWLRQQYHEPVAFYKICEDLDIHRCVLQEWFNALDCLDLLKPVAIKNLVYYAFEPPHGVTSPVRPLLILNKRIVVNACSDFNPELDRSYDSYFSDPVYPDNLHNTFEKYYSVYVNEKLNYEGIAKELPTIINKDFYDLSSKEYYKEKYQNYKKPKGLVKQKIKRL